MRARVEPSGVRARGAPARTPRELARRLAPQVRRLRDALAAVTGDPLAGQLAGLQEPGQDAAQVADGCAQAIAFGLIAARLEARGPGLVRAQIAAVLPWASPALRPLLACVAGPDLDPRVAAIADEIADALGRADEVALGAGEDPLVGFYELFLAAYDPRLRGRRGVYYTPVPVVDYLVRSVDALLRERLDVAGGLAGAAQALILDPALGTGAFLLGILGHVRAGLVAAGQADAWRERVVRGELPRLRGFELLAAPHAVAHLAIGAALARGGAAPAAELLRVTRADALEAAPDLLSGDAAPLAVVLGNPPYSGHSSNRGAWIRGLMRAYSADVPELARPGQAKWLQDDYVKFIRLAQWLVERSGRGIVAYVTSHAWLTNPTFRGMRRSLLASFDEVWALDLHGGSLRKERAPDGGRDENVFEIQQGVAIALLVRRSGRAEGRAPVVRHAELWGTRADKLAVLAAGDVRSTAWQRVEASAPDYLFAPQPAPALQGEYAALWSLAQIFGGAGDPAPGILTTQDALAISWGPEEAIEKVERLLATRTEAEARGLWRLCAQGQWSYARAKRELADGAWRGRVAPILYRPFDLRYTVYDRNVAVHRRERVSSHLLGGANLALLTTRQTKDDWGALCTTHLAAHKSVSRFDVTFVLPLWRFEGEAGGPRPCLAPGFVAALPGAPGPEEVFAYIYALLHAKGYRRRYAELLRGGFARVPATGQAELFAALRGLGARLIALHARGARPEGELPGLPGPGAIARAPTRDEAGRVWINHRQRFEGVAREAWEFTIGGHRPAVKWLADRRGRTLTEVDQRAYARMIAALRETAAIMGRVDAAIEAQGGWPIR